MATPKAKKVQPTINFGISDPRWMTQGAVNDSAIGQSMLQALMNGQAMPGFSGPIQNVDAIGQLLDYAAGIKNQFPTVDFGNFEKRYVNPYINSGNTQIWNAITDYLVKRDIANKAGGISSGPSQQLLNRISNPIFNTDAMQTMGSAWQNIFNAGMGEAPLVATAFSNLLGKYNSNLPNMSMQAWGALADPLSSIMASNPQLAAKLPKLNLPSYDSALSPIARNYITAIASQLAGTGGSVATPQGVKESQMSTFQKYISNATNSSRQLLNLLGLGSMNAAIDQTVGGGNKSAGSKGGQHNPNTSSGNNAAAQAANAALNNSKPTPPKQTASQQLMTLAKSYKTPKEFLKYLNKNQVRLKTSLGKTELQKIYKWAVDMSSKPSEWKKYISQ